MKFFGVVLSVFLAIVALAVADDAKRFYEQSRDLARTSFTQHVKPGCGTPESTRDINRHMMRCLNYGDIQDWVHGADCFDSLVKEIEFDMAFDC